MQTYDLIAHLKRQRAFSRATFGPGIRTKGTIDHIEKELIEIAADERDLVERADLVLLALDGFWRCAEANSVPIEVAVATIERKLSVNECRQWPDWRTADPDKGIEHIAQVRSVDVPATPACCPYTACPSPYVCKGGCKVSASERGHLA